MKRMTLKEVQSVNLEIMKDIHAFCHEHDIRYSLAYGSLIGAVRHRGFIPWDDDIDIMMPRPDFERFSSEYVSKQGYRLSSVYDRDTYVNYTRVYDTKTLMESPAVAARHEVGVWIDVYPIDGIADDEAVSRDQFVRLRHYTSKVMLWRKLLHATRGHDIVTKIKVYARLALMCVKDGHGFRYWHKQICSICKEQPFGTTKRCSSLVCVEANRDDRQEVFRTSDFEDFKLVPFEDQQFYIVTQYDNILKTIFGDYMQVPPKDKQVSHIIKKWGFYWK